MPRLIDADALKEHIKKRIRNEMIIAWLFRIIDEVSTIPPESLRPKGEWICNTDAFTPHKRCTHCGYNKPIAAGLSIEQEPENFCPNCGADMRPTEDRNV